MERPQKKNVRNGERAYGHSNEFQSRLNTVPKTVVQSGHSFKIVAPLCSLPISDFWEIQETFALMETTLELAKSKENGNVFVPVGNAVYKQYGKTILTSPLRVKRVD